MPTFDIIKKSDINESYRVKRIMSDFDVQEKHATEHFSGNLELPEKWNIGVIVGASGTGKTTIAKELFGDIIYKSCDHNNKSVIDDMPQKCSMDEIEKMFYSVGFSSVPSWLKPYNVLSNGEKMRVDVADALLKNDIVVFDEFTSVVDRNIAKNLSMAISKSIRKNNKKFIAVTCHYDVIEYLQPDWIFSTDTMTTNFHVPHDQKDILRLKNVDVGNGKSLKDIII